MPCHAQTPQSRYYLGVTLLEPLRRVRQGDFFCISRNSSARTADRKWDGIGAVVEKRWETKGIPSFAELMVPSNAHAPRTAKLFIARIVGTSERFGANTAMRRRSGLAKGQR